jgi:glycosyltransferase involved in cell wall biosynthesis
MAIGGAPSPRNVIPDADGQGGSRHALIISLTPVTDEPRVRRQALALHEAGWRVSVAGLRGRQPAPEFWRRIEIAHTELGLGLRHTVRSSANKYLSRFSRSAAERAYWLAVNYEGIYQHLAYVNPGNYDLVLCHDWFTAPVAARLGAKLEVPFSIDIHEYARGQYMKQGRLRWRERPWCHALQKRFLPRAGALTTICDGIADLLQEEYSLAERPTVIRSFAQRQELPLRETGERINVLYHGVLAPTRGLEQAIASVPLWRPEFHLIVRGGSDPAYVAALREQAERVGASDRVTIEGPVPASEMIERANADADIGFFVQPDLSPQKRFTLPNKFFEYVTAGLALCVADLPEMARFVHEHDLGLLVPEPTAQAIAAAINSLDGAAIDRYKRNSLEAAKVLDWNLEKEVMLRLSGRLAPAPRPSAVLA